MARPSVRGKLVDAALETFQQRGFNGSSVQDIVDEAGVPKGSFYNHFKTKESLALEVLERYRALAPSELLNDVKKAPLRALRAYFEQLAKLNEKSGFKRGCLMGTFGNELSDATPALREAVDEGFKEWSRSIAEVLRAAQKDGSLSKKQDADRLGRFLLNAWEGSAARAKVTGSRKPIDDFFAVTFDGLLI
jgi:TetR/AcrR family transcriptional repressor of nem operon